MNSFHSGIVVVLAVATNTAINGQFLPTDCFRNGNIISFNVPADAFNDIESVKINIMTVQYDVQRRLPVTSTHLLNEHNQLKVVNRTNKWGPFTQCGMNADMQHNCKKTYHTTPEQQEYSGSTVYDRGHLAPSNPMLFSTTANQNTFYCINIAPQDPFTNEHPWKNLEANILKLFKDEPAYVMTGVSDRDDDRTAEGYSIPQWFWKLICYKHGETTHVYGFMANNTLLNWKDTVGRDQRTKDIFTLRSQLDILNVTDLNAGLIGTAWELAEYYLLENRYEHRVPSASDCTAAKELSEDEYNKWYQFISLSNSTDEEASIDDYSE